MDRLVKADVKEVELTFKRDQKCSTTFRLSNLMHTMSVAVNLTTTNPSLFSFTQPFSIIPPLSSSSYTLLLSHPSDHPPLPTTSPNDVIKVKASMLPTGKAGLDDLRRLFARPGPHVFRDATIPISFVGPQVVEFLISQRSKISGFDVFFDKAVSGCSGSELTALLSPAIASGNASLVSSLIDAGGDVNRKVSDSGCLISLAVRSGSIEVVKILVASGCSYIAMAKRTQGPRFLHQLRTSALPPNHLRTSTEKVSRLAKPSDKSATPACPLQSPAKKVAGKCSDRPTTFSRPLRLPPTKHSNAQTSTNRSTHSRRPALQSSRTPSPPLSPHIMRSPSLSRSPPHMRELLSSSTRHRSTRAHEEIVESSQVAHSPTLEENNSGAPKKQRLLSSSTRHRSTRVHQEIAESSEVAHPPTSEENNTCAPKKQRRGETRGMGIAKKKRSSNPIEIDIPEHLKRAIGENCQSYITEIGCIVRQNAPLQVKYWSEIKRDDVDALVRLVRNFPELEVNWVDSDGRTPIHVAAANGHVEMLKFLVSAGGYGEVWDRKGCTPLHCAAEKGHLEPTKFLLECSDVKYVVTKNGKTAFDLAAENGHLSLLGHLRFDDVLLRAARLDDVHGLKSCLAEGAEVNVRDQNGWTPLHRAAFKGRIECVKVLLNHGAQLDVVDNAGYTPLHCAVEAGHVQVALLLVAHGARANVKSLEGMVSPVSLDRFKNHPALLHPVCHEKERA
ncbi:hypothetical protein ACLB2K_019463 [Fragaria x ananassa]